MKISELKDALAIVDAIRIRLPDGSYLPPHFHVTEVGLISRHFIDCGGVERKDVVANLQLWEAGDYDHRLAPQKFLHILTLSKKVLGDEDLEIEVEYQQATIGKFGLQFDGKDFILAQKYTACLALDACGIPQPEKKNAAACCAPGGGCC